ncbi:MAG: lycopene cyclase family protein [Chitinophagaceae bacterium]
MKQYDYIFIGAGCAGLSLLTRMVAAGLTKGKRILLIDKSPKKENDRTWCFWEQQPGFFETVSCKQWNQLWFHGDGFSKQFDIAPYRYKMIRGIDFYNYCFEKINKETPADILYGTVTSLHAVNDGIQLLIDGRPYTFNGAVVFNSLYNEGIVKQQKAIHLLQHFKGWMVETAVPFFNPDEATLMDFRVSQVNGATFVYVLPLSSTRALVEFTLFSEKLLPFEEYNRALAGYLQHYLQLKDYTVSEEEFGVIPMTDAVFPWYANGMYHIGTAGGQTKASSGYTFQFIQKQSAAIVQELAANILSPQIKPAVVSKRFHFYDAVLLRVLAGKYAAGSQVFTTLFKKNKPAKIFAFLDNETSLPQDLRLIQSLPTLPFIKAACKQLF